MKKIIYITLSLFLLVGVAQAAEKKETKALSTAQQVKLNQITARVAEIKKIDQSSLSQEDKKELKSELMEMKKEAKGISGGGIYISITALLVIIIILIIL